MAPDTASLDFIVNRSKWSEHRFVDGPAPSDPAPGLVLFRVDRFAITANNISYAMAGDMLRYWDFFPAADEGWGRIPTMGFGDVIRSAHPDVPEGQRVFGFFPMSRYLTIEPSNVSPESIFDGAAHRAGIAPAYNTYTRIEKDPGYSAAHEDEHMLMRGLFMTSFLADDYIGDADLGERQVVVGSASSKTAIALAFLLKQRGNVDVVGLTSPRNAAFVKGLGYYDQVLHYDEVAKIAKTPSVLVDMSGNGPVVNALHHHLGDDMKYSCIVGATHWDAGGRDENLPGAKPEFFFAPAQMQKRAQDWGPAGLQERMGASWADFRDASHNWLKVVRSSGRDALVRVYEATLEGRTTPDEGQILSLQDA